MSRTRIALVDDHPLVRQGLRLILDGQQDLAVCAEGASGEDAIAIAERVQPDVLLMDVHMPQGLDGITACRHIRTCCLDVRVLMLTMFDDEIHMERMLAAGACGILLKHGDSTEIFDAIAHGSCAQPWLPRGLSEAARARLEKKVDETAGDPLSPRELEVLVYLASGYTNKEIATRLHISIKTVETHRSNLMRRLNVSTRAELVQYALKHHYVETTPGD